MAGRQLVVIPENCYGSFQWRQSDINPVLFELKA